MGRTNLKIFIFSMVVLISLSTTQITIAENKIILNPEINIERDCDKSEAELVIRITIPSGTSIGSLPEVIEQIITFYKGLWTGDDPLLKKILPKGDTPKASDFIVGSRAILGIDAIIKVERAYREIEEQGLTAFPNETTVISSERFPLHIDCLLDGNGKNSKPEQQPRIEIYEDNNYAQFQRDQLKSNLNNMVVSLISFRSQYSRFPTNLEELKKSGHLLVPFKNPFNKEPLEFKGECGPGTISYSNPDEGHFVLTVFDENNLPIRRELIAGPDNSIRGLLSIEKPVQSDEPPFTIKEQTVRILTFQIGQLLNSFYETVHYLPRSNISHLEAQGFASLNYINPYTGEPIKPVHRIDAGKPGYYWYMMLGEGEYLLVGYGENGREVIKMHRQFFGKLKDKPSSK